MIGSLSAPGVAQAIQLAVAPALLLVGIGNLLNVVAVRLARIVDRVRALERVLPTATDEERAMELAELRVLDRRMKLCHAAVGLITLGGLLVCLVVVLLFADRLGSSFTETVAILFIAAMIALGLGLVFFIVETSVAIRVVKVNEAHLREAMEARTAREGKARAAREKKGR